MFKNLRLPGGGQVWFNTHRSHMVLTLIFSFVAFMVILSELDWKWVSTDRPVSLIHSIFGMITIGLAFIQVYLKI